MNLDKVTRITVVSDKGREFEKYDLFKHGVYLSVQDDGRTLKILPRRAPAGWKGSEERWLRLEALVESGASLNEIRRTLGTDPRTVRKWFPDYRPFPVGGAGVAAEIRKVNQDLKRLDDTGRMTTRRHAR